MMKVNRMESSHAGGHISKMAIFLAILAGTMALTNPSRQDYLEYASVKLSQEAKNNLCNEAEVPAILRGFSNIIVDTCNTLVTSQRGTIRAFIDNSTHRKNAMIFSIYTSELLNNRYRTLALFGNFITFSAEKLPENSVE
ncbi:MULTISPECIES: DUF4359 domain-containing protein [Oscillatoriales]|uniref:DUF4359 domain-containing protein n=3 Tax=Limnospira TaxID=2596745 RepID=B5W4Q9_LIMMA|nr:MULTISPECIES: DUF4359 domain-containing protein [Oscillatoriales]AMW28666.1 hypothetical protein AP285_12515 [Arthrospira platensis YZ]EKD11778.1 hypothetical protein SPLC1_S011770 [Arthrospira platensis C1]MBD2671923.1 DUF4359 domain-containing protein [Arthrospira platensis FACHB-439]MBD2712974.1 DUF4359 domain-containing protein [Arthrospira platensis FACHB-835]MDC0839520.1 DUF4359 domain-containing protein [Limnoraphis robusta]MDY7053417.1 DUF4359 domain-containing protein [Limnospira 